MVQANKTELNEVPGRIARSIQTGSVLPTNESPTGALWKSDWNNWAPRLGFAWDVSGDGRTSVRGGWGMGYERNFGNVTYNVLFNPPKYLVASIAAADVGGNLPVFVDNAGPFGGVAGVTKTIPAGSLRHVDQNIETAYAHFYGLSLQKQIGQALTGSIEYTGSSGRKLYDLADPNKVGAELVYLGNGSAILAQAHSSVAPGAHSTPAATAANRRTTASRSGSTRGSWRTPDCSFPRSTR